MPELLQNSPSAFLEDAARQSLHGWWQFWLAIFAYIVLFTFRLEDFPIYFFCDEAFPTITGVELYKNGLRDSSGTIFPLYFEAAVGRWTPVFTVYFYGLAALLGGNSILLARSVGVLFSLMAPVGCALTLRYVFKARYWWIAIPLFAVNPGWIIHARTAFEAVTMTSFYSLFILFYLLARRISIKFLPLAGLFGACAFYTYSNGQVVVVCTVLLTIITSTLYYIKNLRVTALSIILAALLSLPLINFRLNHGEKLEEHLRTVDSYLVKNIPAVEKLGLFTTNYLSGLSPFYWFIPNQHDSERHRLQGYPHISLALLPFLFCGLLVAIRSIKKIEYRLPILALISAPVGGALLDILILRAIVIMVPVVLLSTLGLNVFLTYLSRYFRTTTLSIVMLVSCFAYTCGLLHQALYVQPSKYLDYGLYGVQFGAKQLFVEKIPYFLAHYPNSQIILSPIWANGTERFPEFFLDPKDRQRINLDSMERYLIRKTSFADDSIFIITGQEYKKVVASNKFSSIDVLDVIPYPSGAPGFYFLKLTYAENADQLFAKDQEFRRRLIDAPVNTVAFHGVIHHSLLDMGEIKNIFDGNSSTLIRGMEANPLVIDLDFATPKSIAKVGINANPTRLHFKIQAFAENKNKISEISQMIMLDQSKPLREIPFIHPLSGVSRLRIELSDIDAPEVANIHVWELLISED